MYCEYRRKTSDLVCMGCRCRFCRAESRRSRCQPWRDGEDWPSGRTGRSGRSRTLPHGCPCSLQILRVTRTDRHIQQCFALLNPPEYTCPSFYSRKDHKNQLLPSKFELIDCDATFYFLGQVSQQDYTQYEQNKRRDRFFRMQCTYYVP